ncbi:MAG TPA: hypothetical protein VGH53_08890 [Streptosporangiaceae bacterium]
MGPCWRVVQFIEQPVQPVPPALRLIAARGPGDYPAAADRTARGTSAAARRRVDVARSRRPRLGGRPAQSLLIRPLLVTGRPWLTGRPEVTGRLALQPGRPARRGEGAEGRGGKLVRPVGLAIVPVLLHQLSLLAARRAGRRGYSEQETRRGVTRV